MLDPCLGFSSEEVEIPGLAEGLIFPEQEELSVHRRLFQNNQKRGDGTLDLRSGEPSFIRILVGTKEAVEIWLKSSGPACCALWIEVAEIQMEFRVPDEARKALNGELQLAYRLRLYSALFCSVLKGVTFRLSPYWKKHRSSSENRTRVPPHSRSKLESLRQKEKERFLRSVGITHLGDDFCAKAGKAQGTALPKKQWIRKWLAKIPVEAFKQLLTMLSTGGALFEFQQVLLRIVHIPYFLDVNFHLVDVLDWLRSHRFVVLLEGLDLVVAAQGLKWSIIRFSFVEGFIKIAADDSLSSLLQIFGLREENASRSYDSSPGVEFPKADSYLKTYGTTNDSETSFNSLTWEAWEPSPKEQDSLQAGLRRTGLLDGMLLQGSDSFLEFLWDDFNPIFPKLTEVQRAVKKHPKASQSMVLELKPICFIPSVRLSSKEKCALCNLGSSDRTVRQRGIRFLLRLMQRGTRNSSTKPSARRSSRSLNDKVQSAPIPDKLLTCLQKHLKYNGICSSSEDILIEGEHKPVENSQKRQSLQQTAVSEGVIVTRGTANDAVEIVRIEGLSSTLAHGNQARTGSTEWRDDNRETEKAGFNSQPCSSRFIDRSESNQSNLFEESTYDHSGVLTDDREFSLNFETIWSRLSEWVQNGFTDALITELIMAKRNGSTKEDKWLNVQELTNTCLQVIAILPGEGSYHMVQSLKKSLENCIQEHNVLSAGNFCEKGRCSMLLKNDQDIEGGPSDVAALHFQKLPRYEKVQEACWRTWRLGRILYIILQRSTITSALLAECGGLDLILELYSCLVKNLLANRIHLGHTSFRFNAANDHGPSLLPGEVSEKEKVTSKVFPFFNAISLLVGAQKSAPRKAFKECCSVVDGQSDGNFTGNTKSSVESFAKRFAKGLLSWASEWFIGRHDKHKSISDHAELCPSEESTCKLCQKKKPFFQASQYREEGSSRLCKTNIAEAESYENTPIASMTAAKRGMLSSWVGYENRALPLCNKAQSKGEDLTRLQRPRVPKLRLDPLTRPSLSTFLGPDRKFQSKVDMNFPRSQSGLATDSTCSSLTYSRSSLQSSSETFNILCEAKYSLLQALALLLAYKNPVLSTAKQHLKLKLVSGNETHYSFCFMIDLISCFRDESSSANRNIQKLIFEVVFLLDNDDIYFKQSQYRKVQKTDHLTWSSLGPPAEQLLGSFSYHLLMEISEQLKTVLADWCQLLPDYGLDNDHKDLSTGGSSDGRQSYEGSNSLFLYKAAYHWRGICSSLWAYLSILLRILTVYIDSSPKDAAGGVLFKSCGEHIESVFHLLAASDGSPTWSHPQRQALQSLLSLFQASLQDCMQDRNPALAGWSDFEELFWQMTVKNKLHWEFMKNCLNWVVLKSCHGCRRSLVGTSHNSIVEPARIQLGTPEETKVLSSPCQDTDILKSSIKWISSVVHLIQRKIDAQNAFLQDSLFLFSPGQMLCLLDFLMNPVEGMVMKTFKDSFSCHKVVKRQVSHGLPFIQEESTCHAAPSPSCQGLASSQTTVSFSSNLSHKTMLGSTSSSSEIEWPQHRNKQLNSSSEMDDTHEAEINSDMNYNINPCPVDHGICHQQQCLPVYALEELPRKLCRSCTKLTSAQLLCDEMSFLIQQEIASLSAEIFTVRFCGSSRQDYILAVKQKSAIENPFLSSTYVDPFLEYHFLGLSQLYSQETQQWGPPKDQIELDSTDCESSKVEDSNPDCRVETLATTMNSEDEKVTATCLRHVAVLLALAQNQTEYVSQKFKQLKVMDFLLKQITLEYESSNVATPRDLYTESRDHNVFEATNIKKVMNEENGCGTVGFLQNKQNCIQDHMQSQSLLQIKEYSADHKLKGHELKEAVRLAIVEAAFSNPEKDCLSAKTDSNSTGQTSFDIPNYGAPRLSHNSSDELDVQCCVSNPDNRIENVLGFEINKEGEFLHENNIFCKDECGNLHYNTDEYSDGSHARYGDVFFYSGRFFDLNEEVERELAEEEILIGLAEGNEASDSSALKDSSRQEEVNEDTSTGDLVAVRVHSQLEDDNETFCSGKEGSETIVLKSLDEFENSVLHPGKKQSVRSVVPKLNLPKSARKGDQESVTSNDSVDREFVKMSADIGHMKKLSMQGLCSRSTPEDLMNISIWQEKTSSMTYETERSKRRIYRNTNLHLSLLELFVSLMLTPQGTLEACYSDRFPTEGQKLNAPFFLSYHLNHAANAYVLPLLTKKMKDYQSSAFRILKLSCRELFDPSIYTNRLRIAHGAFAQVYTATIQEDGTDGQDKLVVLKIVDLPKSFHDPCKFFDVYSEVEILEKFSGEPRVCQLLDYGVDLESFIIVLKHYKCSLKAWRHQHNAFCNVVGSTELKVAQAFNGRLALYLEVYAAVLKAVKVLEAHNVVHYDIKCDNILLEPVEGLSLEEEFWDPLWPPLDTSCSLPFRVCIADFGQSKASILQGGECTVRNRGTEYVKSPEMLKLLSVGGSLNPDLKAENLDETVGKAVDIWGLGCLLYELLTGEYLLYDEDWIRFFIRVTLPSEELITKEKAAKVEHNESIIDFLRFVLVRDPVKRPTLDDLISRLAQLQSKLKNECSSKIHLDRGKNPLPDRKENVENKPISSVDHKKSTCNSQIPEVHNYSAAPNDQNVCDMHGAITDHASDYYARNSMTRDDSYQKCGGTGDDTMPIDLQYTDQGLASTRFWLDCLCFGCEC